MQTMQLDREAVMTLSQETQTKTPKMSMFSITQARGRLRGGPKATTDTNGKGGDGMKDVKGDRGGPKMYRVVRSYLGLAKIL